VDNVDVVKVRYLDVVFDAGVPVQQLTVFPLDELIFEPDRIVVRFVEKSQETVVIFLDHVRFYSLRDGEQRTVKTDEEGRPLVRFSSIEEYIAFMRDKP
jgi:hypothetical protein